MPAQVIKIRGARQHNLKNLHLGIPAGRFLFWWLTTT
jgi:excinuclease UvrABC ATPase subunit